MRTKSKWVINLVHALLTGCWYINIVLAIIGFSALTINFATKDHTTIGIYVKKKGIPSHTALETLSPVAKYAYAENDQAVVRMELKINAWLVIEAYTFFIGIEAIIILVLYHLRKIFAAFKSEDPFQYIIVTRLRIVAVCLCAGTLLKAAWGLADYLTLTGNIKDFSRQFMVVWSDNFMGIIIGVLLYVIAEVFRYGMLLEQENKQFV